LNLFTLIKCPILTWKVGFDAELEVKRTELAHNRIDSDTFYNNN